MLGIILAAAVIGGTGILIGLLLGFAGEKLKVEVDQLEIDIREALPGNNCGGCGFPGCDGLAKAIAEGNAKNNACPVGGSALAERLAEIMGSEVGEIVRKTAFVKCGGTCDVTKDTYKYSGVQDCTVMPFVPNGGAKTCTYGCMGYGSCVKACQFDAIHIVNGIALVDREACVACGKCVEICPRHLIDLIPYESHVTVNCASKDKGKDVKAACSVGCIGCGICVKQCEFDAIHVENNIAYIDYDQCTGCGKCVAKCPSKIIKLQA
ncbi:MAG: RnfABCDGE type electron transport complex subunit B [Lacrimispora sphenoides]